MALRFNPPPNWPKPPEGFEPPAGWQPDPAWGPAPEGWQIWVDDAASPAASVSGNTAASAPSVASSAPSVASSAPAAASGADPAWAPTQAVSTSGNIPVASPTGDVASAPTGDFAPSYSPSAGMGVGASSPAAVPAGNAGTSPYSPSGNYPQSPTAFQGAPSVPSGSENWQAVNNYTAAAATKPVTKQWWFWTIIAVVVVLVLVLTMTLINQAVSSDNSSSSSSTSSSSSRKDSDKEKEKEKEEDSSGAADKSDDSGNSGDSESTEEAQEPDSAGNDGRSEAKALNPDEKAARFSAGKYSSNAGSSVTVEITEVNWDATQTIADAKTFADPPPAGSVYVRVKVKITYEGTGQFSAYDLDVNYVKNGNAIEPTRIYNMKDEFRDAAMPYSGGTAEGYFTFAIPQENAKSGAWVVKGYYDSKEVYFQAK